MSVFKTKTIRIEGTNKKKFAVSRNLSSIKFTIKLELDGGECAVSQLDVKTGQKYSFPEVVKADHIIGGWYADSSFQNEITEDETVDYNVQTIYIKWEPANFLTLTYLDGTSSYLKSNYQTLNWSDIGKTTYSDSATNIVKAVDKGQSVYSMGQSVFRNVYTLEEASFPVCTHIGTYAFYYCSSLTAVSFPACTSMATYAFYMCSKLSQVSFPTCSLIGSNAFYTCSKLIDISFPACTSIYSSAFYRCYSLSQVQFPLCTVVGSGAFRQCSSMATVSLPMCKSIYSSAFYGCRMLSSLYLMGSTVCYLQNSRVFTSTPIAGYSTYNNNKYGSIYVPNSLLTTYKRSTGWSTFSNRFVGV